MAAYARQPVARSVAGWAVAGNSATLVAEATFPIMAGGAGGVATHFGVGLAVSGANELDFFGAITPNLTVAVGSVPVLDTSTAVTQATGDGMTNAAATKVLELYFNNTAWANVGDAPGLQPSAADGNVFLSLHTASPAEAGNQSTNEISYT